MKEIAEAAVDTYGGEVYDDENGAVYARFNEEEAARKCAAFLSIGNFVGLSKNSKFFCVVVPDEDGSGGAILKVAVQTRRGAPNGNANAKKPEVKRRIALNTSIKKETRAELFRRAEEAGVSIGRIIDGLVSPP